MKISGKVIEQKFQESGLKITVFAERINTGERNVYSLFKREDINAEMLSNISKVLNFNFFKLYESKLPESLVLADNGAEYLSPRTTMKLSFSVAIPTDSMDEIPGFLQDIKEAAAKHGARLE